MIGEVFVKISGFEMQKHINRIQKGCKVKHIYTQNDNIFVNISIFHKKSILNYCKSNNLLYEIISENGIIVTSAKYIKRYGFAIGAIFALILTFFMSNIAFKVKVVGYNTEEIKSEILEILKEEGLKPGAYIPTLNFINLENKLIKESKYISWASIGCEGAVITVNVNAFTNKSESIDSRIPSNIIASREGQIVKAEVLIGELCAMIGAPVKKGDLLVSGISESRNGNAYYKHSIGSIIAEFEEIVTFEQMYYETFTHYGNTNYAKYFIFFEFDIPILARRPQYTEFNDKEAKTQFKFLGVELPFGIKTVEYKKIAREEIELSTDEAEALLFEKIDKYENNLLSNYEIIEKEVNTEYTEDGITAKVRYILQGEIGEQSPIYYKDKNADNY